MSIRLFSRAWQEITKKIKKNYTINFWTLYFTHLPGGPCYADCSKFLHVGWHPRRNHAYQILSRSRRGLRSCGGPKSGFSYSFSNRSYNSVSHYRATLWYIVQPILKARTVLCMRRSTWPGGWRSKITAYLESPTPICLFTIQLLGAPMTIKGSLLMSLPIIKRFWPKILSRQKGV